jgi:hypothetical protein
LVVFNQAVSIKNNVVNFPLPIILLMEHLDQYRYRMKNNQITLSCTAIAPLINGLAEMKRNEVVLA